MTQNARILQVLADRDWHSHHEFYGWCVLHSRISELRRRGHRIETRRQGDLYLYRLAPAGVLPEPPTPAVFHAHGNDADTCAVPRRGGGSGNAPTAVRAGMEQLVLGQVA